MIEVLSFLTGLIRDVISTLGYPGITLLMAMESTATPVPSELVMPFAGYLVSTGRFELWLVILFGTVGCLLGSLFSYFIGRSVGLALVHKYGKFILISGHDLELTDRFFQKHGEKAIFFSRFIPVVRHLISIPAGIAKMNVWKFSMYTLLGSFCWVSILSWAGLKLGENWQAVRAVTEKFSYVILLVLVAVAIYFVRRHLRH